MYGLPMEIFAKIVWHTLRDGTRSSHDIPSDYYKNLHLLAQVSTGWATINKHSPQLWAAVDASDTRDSWATALRLSRSHILDIRLERLLRDKGEFWDAITENIHRWRMAYILVSFSVGLHILSSAPPRYWKRSTSPTRRVAPINGSSQSTSSMAAPGSYYISSFLTSHFHDGPRVFYPDCCPSPSATSTNVVRPRRR